MLSFAQLVAAALLLCASCGEGASRPGNANFRRKPIVPIPPVHNMGPVVSQNGTVLPPYSTTYTFQQLIDHNNSSLGTFSQRYWHTYEFYEPGGPIIFFTPGEINASPYLGYLTNGTINGQIAQQENGAAIVLEHRFYGLSNPLPDLSVASLRLHTIQQAIEDLKYFAENVVLPMPNGGNLKPSTTPWILVGGSYSGALTSYTMVNKPGLFAAGYGSSATVQTIFDFWQYFEPSRQYMAPNCSADIVAAISHIDKVFTGSNTTAIQAIKNTFGMGAMTHLDDLVSALRNHFWDWQALSLRGGAGGRFFEFCDALEVKNGVNAPAAGWGAKHALNAWGQYWNQTYYALICGNATAVDCFDTYNPTQPYYTDITIDNAGRSWQWIVCNEVGFFQDASPKGTPSMVSRLIQPAYDLRQCQLMFPEAFPTIPTAQSVKTAQTNSLYAGWNVSVSNLFLANGKRDPWRYATLSAPGVTKKSTSELTIAIGEGFHCGDLSTAEAAANPSVLAVQKAGLAAIKDWIEDWEPAETD
ncbi:unnamed protein product [Mycena citricolor]|uniref:Peptidase S28 n=1 Tax=Mycena citricolor TaxID=2018698 RepID=A0AAD2GS09_9AGAR|nr:unnamed protein product [Mycena citricolor]